MSPCRNIELEKFFNKVRPSVFSDQATPTHLDLSVRDGRSTSPLNSLLMSAYPTSTYTKEYGLVAVLDAPLFPRPPVIPSPPFIDRERSSVSFRFIGRFNQIG